VTCPPVPCASVRPRPSAASPPAFIDAWPPGGGGVQNRSPPRVEVGSLPPAAAPSPVPQTACPTHCTGTGGTGTGGGGREKPQSALPPPKGVHSAGGRRARTRDTRRLGADRRSGRSGPDGPAAQRAALACAPPTAVGDTATGGARHRTPERPPQRPLRQPPRGGKRSVRARQIGSATREGQPG